MTCKAIGVFGGTFNPIHNGHLRSAVEIRDALKLERVLMMPAAIPPLREAPECDAGFRASLVELAVAGEPGLVCDRRELSRSGTSYTYDTLAEIREELGPSTSLVLIIGCDGLERFDQWYRWQDILELAHLVVIARPGWQPPQDGPVADWLAHQPPAESDDLRASPAGRVLLKTLRQLPVSSTEIRRLVADGKSPRYLLPDAVWQQIQQSGVYRSDTPPQENHGTC